MAFDPIGFIQSKLDQQSAERTKYDYVTEWTERHSPLTFGPFGNNLGKNYAFDKGSWNINFIDKMSPDVVIIFLSKMSQLYKKTSTPTITLPIHRDVKDVLIKDKFPHHVSREW